MRIIEKFKEIDYQVMEDWYDYFNPILLIIYILMQSFAFVLTPIRERWFLFNIKSEEKNKHG